MRPFRDIEYPDQLSQLITQAESCKDKKAFAEAKSKYAQALELSPDNVFLIQRYALVTYKLALPNAQEALLEAQLILSELDPEEFRDAETQGLGGAINKRLFEETGDKEYLEKAVEFYSRGFSANGDYYNGINVAYMFLLKATVAEDEVEAFVCFKNAAITNRKIISDCTKQIAAADFSERNDQHFVYQTLAQAYLGNEMNHEVIKLIPTINEVSKGSFDLDTFHEQNTKIIDAIVKFLNKYPS